MASVIGSRPTVGGAPKTTILQDNAAKLSIGGSSQSAYGFPQSANSNPPVLNAGDIHVEIDGAGGGIGQGAFAPQITNPISVTQLTPEQRDSAMLAISVLVLVFLMLIYRRLGNG